MSFDNGINGIEIIIESKKGIEEFHDFKDAESSELDVDLEDDRIKN